MVRASDGAPKSSAPTFFEKNVEGTSKKGLGRSNNPIELIFYSRETSQPSYSFCPTQMGGEAKGEAKFQIESENNGHSGRILTFISKVSRRTTTDCICLTKCPTFI